MFDVNRDGLGRHTPASWSASSTPSPLFLSHQSLGRGVGTQTTHELRYGLSGGMSLRGRLARAMHWVSSEADSGKEQRCE